MVHKEPSIVQLSAFDPFKHLLDVALVAVVARPEIVVGYHVHKHGAAHAHGRFRRRVRTVVAAARSGSCQHQEQWQYVIEKFMHI